MAIKTSCYAARDCSKVNAVAEDWLKTGCCGRATSRFVKS